MNELILNKASDEKEAEKTISTTEAAAEALTIADDVGFAYAGEFAKKIKDYENKIIDYWEPMRKSTYEAYKKVNDAKKKMLDPLTKAEKIVKKKISDYAIEKERKHREAEEAMKREAMDAANRKIEEAIEAERSGNAGLAEFAMAEAEAYTDAANYGKIAKEDVKVKGLSKSKTWVITDIDLAKVPTELLGVIIRPVDEKAVLNLIKLSKGSIEIPGIKYEETYNISVSAK